MISLLLCAAFKVAYHYCPTMVYVFDMLKRTEAEE